MKVKYSNTSLGRGMILALSVKNHPFFRSAHLYLSSRRIHFGPARNRSVQEITIIFVRKYFPSENSSKTSGGEFIHRCVRDCLITHDKCSHQAYTLGDGLQRLTLQFFSISCFVLVGWVGSVLLQFVFQNS